MMDATRSWSRLLLKWTAIGAVVETAMVIAGWYSTSISNLYGVLGMGISLVIGILYARDARGSAGNSIVAGGVAGGLAGGLGILVGVVFGELEPMLLVFGTCGSLVAGAVGGVLTHFVTRRRPLAA